MITCIKNSFNFGFLSFLFFIFFNFHLVAQGTCSSSNSECDPVLSKSVPFVPANVDLTFDTFSKYVGGVTLNAATILKVVAVDKAGGGTCIWKLKMRMDNEGSPSDEWKTVTSYGAGTGGFKPSVDVIKVRVDNGCHTPINAGNWQDFSNDGTMLPIIEDNSLNAANGTTTCSGAAEYQTNGPGTYLGPDFGEFIFNVDYQITPGFTLSPGLYRIKIWFCLSEI